jgi:hypothetical protein
MVMINRIDLARDEAELAYVRDGLGEGPPAVVDVNDRQFHEHACRLGQSAPSAPQNLALEALRVDLDQVWRAVSCANDPVERQASHLLAPNDARVRIDRRRIFGQIANRAELRIGRNVNNRFAGFRADRALTSLPISVLGRDALKHRKCRTHRLKRNNAASIAAVSQRKAELTYVRAHIVNDADATALDEANE